MNWLAHIFVSQNCIDYQLGNLLADPLKGKAWNGANHQVVAGFMMHRSIDTFTDTNTLVHRSKARLGQKGYLKGVVVDIAYDYLLHKNWGRYSHIEADCFIQSFFENAELALHACPVEARHFVHRLRKHDVLTRYATMDGLEEAFARMDDRLSNKLRARETTSAYLPRLKEEIGAMEKDFIRFFPQLLANFISQSSLNLDQHWIKSSD